MVGSLYFTCCLLPKVSINSAQQLAPICSTTIQSKTEKGFKFYLSSYLYNFESKLLMQATSSWAFNLPFSPLSKPAAF